MTEIKKNEIKIESDRDLIRVNINVTLKRQLFLIIAVLILGVAVACAVSPNEEVRNYLLEILLGVMQLLWPGKRD